MRGSLDAGADRDRRIEVAFLFVKAQHPVTMVFARKPLDLRQRLLDFAPLSCQLQHPAQNFQLSIDTRLHNLMFRLRRSPFERFSQGSGVGNSEVIPLPRSRQIFESDRVKATPVRKRRIEILPAIGINGAGNAQTSDPLASASVHSWNQFALICADKSVPSAVRD